MEPVAIKELMTRLSKEYGTPNKGLEAMYVPALRRVPKPPKAYRELKCTLGLSEGEERRLAVERFFKRLPDFLAPVKEYQEILLETRNYNFENAEYALAKNHINYGGNNLFDDNYDPIDRIQRKVFPEDLQYYWVLLVDFNFKRTHGKLFMEKIYIPLYPSRFFS